MGVRMTAQKPEKTGTVQGIKRDAKGRIVKGVSGNPKGKPVGLKNRFTIANLQALDDAVKQFGGFGVKNFWQGVLELSVKLAKKGNVGLLCKVLDKMVANKTLGEGSDETPEQLPFTVRTFAPASRN